MATKTRRRPEPQIVWHDFYDEQFDSVAGEPDEDGVIHDWTFAAWIESEIEEYEPDSEKPDVRLIHRTIVAALRDLADRVRASGCMTAEEYENLDQADSA